MSSTVGSEKPRACPFCGHERIIQMVRETGAGPECYFMHCTTCGADGPTSPRKVTARLAWNDRLQPKPVRNGGKDE